MGKKIVLITEDETEIRELLVSLFQSEGFDVLDASDGKQALDLLQEHGGTIALLITDLGLPKLGGMELIRLSRKIVPGLNIIAASGFGHRNVRSDLLRLGVEDFFPKPFSPIELLVTARRLIDKDYPGDRH